MTTQYFSGNKELYQKIKEMSQTYLSPKQKDKPFLVSKQPSFNKANLFQLPKISNFDSPLRQGYLKNKSSISPLKVTYLQQNQFLTSMPSTRSHHFLENIYAKQLNLNDSKKIYSSQDKKQQTDNKIKQRSEISPLSPRYPVPKTDRSSRNLPSNSITNEQNLIRYLSLLRSENQRISSNVDPEAIKLNLLKNSGIKPQKINAFDQIENKFDNDIRQRYETFSKFAFTSIEKEDKKYLQPFFNSIEKKHQGSMNITELWNRNFTKNCLKIANLSESKKLLENETFQKAINMKTHKDKKEIAQHEKVQELNKNLGQLVQEEYNWKMLQKLNDDYEKAEKEIRMIERDEIQEEQEDDSDNEIQPFCKSSQSIPQKKGDYQSAFNEQLERLSKNLGVSPAFLKNLFKFNLEKNALSKEQEKEISQLYNVLPKGNPIPPLKLIKDYGTLVNIYSQKSNQKHYISQVSKLINNLNELKEENSLLSKDIEIKNNISESFKKLKAK